MVANPVDLTGTELSDSGMFPVRPILEQEVLNSPNSYVFVGSIIVLPAISAQCNKQVVWSRKPYGNPYALNSTKPTSPNSYVFGVCISLSQVLMALCIERCKEMVMVHMIPMGLVYQL